jgi:hypothetical protein
MGIAARRAARFQPLDVADWRPSKRQGLSSSISVKDI